MLCCRWGWDAWHAHKAVVHSLWAKSDPPNQLHLHAWAQSRMNHKRHTSVMLLVSFASRARKAITVATHEQPNRLRSTGMHTCDLLRNSYTIMIVNGPVRPC